MTDPLGTAVPIVEDGTPARQTLLEIGLRMAEEMGIELPIAREAVEMSHQVLRSVPDVQRTDEDRERCLKAYWLGYYQTLQDTTPTYRTARKIKLLRQDLGLES